LTATIKKLWKNGYFQTLIVVALIVLIVFGFWFGSQLALNTKIPPALAVVSGSMCIPYDQACTGWLSLNHPFARTLHKGDIVIIQGVNPEDLNANYPDSDVIVFHSPITNELIVHRIIGKTEVNGTIYFMTKGDGNGNVWPQTPQTGLDPWDYYNPTGVSEDCIEGKVIMRIPWVGYIALFMKSGLGSNSSIIVIPIIVVLIILLIVIEFVVPLLRRKKVVVEQKTALD
jgi:signal peptidase I